MNTELSSGPDTASPQLATQREPQREPQRGPLVPIALLGAVLVGLVFARLSAYGIWDPWELGVADAARKLGENAAEVPGTLTLRLVSLSFAAFGAREWAGRLPLALFGLVLLWITFAWVRALSDRRTALFSVAVLASTPFFVLHSREMVGATPAFTGAALVMLGSSAAVFGRDLSAAKLWGGL